ncbi:T9SS type A sorting domain-containing protein [Hymenobacter ruber]
MKFFFYALSLTALLGAPAAHAQITPEKVYTGEGEMIRLSTGDYKYQMTVHNSAAVITRVMVYNLNHSVYKQLNVPVIGTTYEAQGVQYVSDALFDTNPATLEYMVDYGTTQQGLMRKSIIFSETGSQLAVFDSTNYYMSVYNTPAGAKLVSNIQVYNSATNSITRQYSRVYGLPGRLALRAATPVLPDAAGAYPNPAQSTVALPYVVPTNTTGTLQVFDASGRLAASYQVDGHVDHLALSTRDLRPGVYVYRVATAAGTTAGRRFTIE